MWWFLTPKVVFGEDAIDYLETLEGKKALIITDKVIRKMGYVDIVTQKLLKAGFEFQIYDEVEPEPSYITTKKGAQLALDFEPDKIIGVGGGSVLDAAKMIFVFYERPDLNIEDVHPFVNLNLRKKAILIGIPTTAGTGSEATWAAVITLTESHKKHEVPSRELVPDIAIVDPQLTVKLPPQLTVTTGLDALTHAVEAYTCTWSNDFTDGIALHAIKLIFEYLPIAYREPEYMDARTKMANAATLAGIAFSNSSLTLAHSLAHSFGGFFKIHHGRACSLFLPYAIEFQADNQPRYADIAKLLNLEFSSSKEAGYNLAGHIRTFRKNLGEANSLIELGFNEQEIVAKLPDLVEYANQSGLTVTSPRVPSNEEYEKLYRYAMVGKSVDF